MADSVVINEVGLRDGLQNQQRPISTANKLELARRLLASGIRNLEVTSFVHPQRVPQLADAEALIAGLPAREGVGYTALIPNLRGYQRARAAGVQQLALVLGATDTFNRRNINLSLEDARRVCREVLARARADDVPVCVYLACACACPYEGVTPLDRVLALAGEMFASGASQVSVADTIGAGTPQQVFEVCRPLVEEYGAARVSLHVHDTRGRAVAMVWSGYLAGVRNFDAAIGGLGGCPFAPGAAGNAATEDLVALFNDSGIETGIDFAALMPALELAETMTGQVLGGRSMDWWRARCIREVVGSEVTGHVPGTAI